MDLRKYLTVKKLKIKTFCLDNDLDYGYFRHILNNRKRPSPDMALKIERATRGSVSKVDLLYPKQKRAA
jgi:hypothetical protein